VDGALAAFRKARELVRPAGLRTLQKSFLVSLPRSQDIPVPHHSFNVLLHLCTGGNQPDGPEKRILLPQADEVCARFDVLHTRVHFSDPSHRESPLTCYATPVQIYEYMKIKGCAPIESTYTALARAAAASGNPDRARQLVSSLVAHATSYVFMREIRPTGKRNETKRSRAEIANIHTSADGVLRSA
jgi:hypothetical protein